MALSTSLSFPQMITKWAAELNPFLSRPTNNAQLIDANLVSGSNVINHRLGRTMQGWSIVDQNASAEIYRVATAPLNDLTLTLSSSATVTVRLAVF